MYFNTGGNNNINKTFIIEPLSITGGSPTLSACTTMYTDLIESCSGDTSIQMGTGNVIFNSDVYGVQNFTASTIEAVSFTSGGTNLLDIFIRTIDANTFVTGGTFTDITDSITLVRNDNTNVIITGLTNTFTTGGTYDINTGIVSFTNNSGGTFDVTGFSSGMTDSYTTTATTVGDSIQFDNNLNGSNLYNVNLTPIISGKTDVILFNSYTGDTTIHFELSAITMSNIGNSAHTHTINEIIDFNGYSGSVQTLIDLKLDTLIFNTYTSTTIDNNFYTTGTTYNNGTLYFDRTDTLSAYTTDLTSLTADTFITGITYTPLNNTISVARNDLTVFIAEINEMSSLTINGPLSALTINATTFYGDGSNLTGIPHTTDTYTTGVTFINNLLKLTNSTGGTYETIIDNFTGITVNGLISGQTVSGLVLNENGVNINTIYNTITQFDTHTGNTNNPHNVTFSALTSTGHTHIIGDVIGLQTALNTRLENGNNLGGEGLYTGKTSTDFHLKGIASSGGTVTITSDGTTVNLEIPTDTNTFVTGGTSDSATTLTFTNNTGGTFTVEQTETKRYVETNGFDITAGVAYLGTSGTKFLSFQGGTLDDEQASYNFAIPSDYISGGTFYIKFTTLGTTSNIQFEMNITSRDNGGDMSTPTDTALQNTTAGSIISWGMVETAAYTPSSSTFYKDKNITIRLNRDASDAPDTYTGVAYVWGIVFEYTGIK